MAPVPEVVSVALPLTVSVLFAREMLLPEAVVRAMFATVARVDVRRERDRTAPLFVSPMLSVPAVISLSSALDRPRVAGVPLAFEPPRLICMPVVCP